jgi:hypothetical protein
MMKFLIIQYPKMMYSEIYNKSEYDCVNNNDTLYESINTNPLHSSDIEHIFPIKGILKNKIYENEHIHNKEIISKYSLLLFNYTIRFIIIITTLPFLFCDLSFAIDNEQCLSTYPHNFNLNFKIFLYVSTVMEIFIVLYNTLYYCYHDNYKYISLQILNKIFELLLIISYFIWNIIGVFIFGSIIYNTNICNNTLYNYLIISIIIKIIVNFIVIINYKI